MVSTWLAIAISFALIAVLIIFYTRWVADSTLTDQFRAAESISNGRFPQKWTVQINRLLAWRPIIAIFQPQVTGTTLALQRIDRLMRFFEKSPFFENEDTRQILLEKLKTTRQQWQYMTWEQLQKEIPHGSS